MKRANKINARAAVLLGEDELARSGRDGARPRQRRARSEVPLAQLAERLAPFR